MNTICVKAVISGKVQGVFYRSGTRKKAQSMNLTGWIKNNDNGTVELIACGDEENLKTLIDWLWIGPDAATVDDVVWSEMSFERHDGFEIR